MKNCLRPFLPLLAAAALLPAASCSTDFDSNAPYQEIPVLYGILDPEAAVQTVRIDKAFLNSGTDATIIAATEADSTQFPAGVITATLEKLRPDSSVADVFPFVREANTEKEAGSFVRAGQYVYRAAARLETGATYRVRAVNRRNGAVLTAATSTPDPVRILLAGTRSVSVNYNPVTSMPLLFQPELQLNYVFQTQERAGLYNAQLEFNYQEIIGTDTVRKVAIWPLVTNLATTASQMSEVRINRPAYAFFREFLNSAIDTVNQNPNVRRRVGEAVFRVTAGSPQWATYNQVLNSYSALSQTVPEYTNVRGGRGLLVGRRQSYVRTAISFINSSTTTSTVAAFQHFPGLRFVF